MHIQTTFLTRDTGRDSHWPSLYPSTHLWWDETTGETFWIPVRPCRFSAHPAMPILRLTNGDYEEWPMEDSFRTFRLKPAGLSSAYGEARFKYNAATGDGFVSPFSCEEKPQDFTTACCNTRVNWLEVDHTVPFDAEAALSAVPLQSFRWLFRCPQLAVYLQDLVSQEDYKLEYNRISSIRDSNKHGILDVSASLLETCALFAEVCNTTYYGNDLRPYDSLNNNKICWGWPRFVPVDAPIVVVGNYISESCNE